ncbi:MAG: DUF3341 domain-containing protein [Rhodospirillaceae bacterium]
MKLWGYLAEFDSPAQLIEAVRTLRAEGYTHFDAHTPFPIEGLAEHMGFEENRVDPVHVMAGLAAGAVALGIMLWANAYSYPLNIGGRPLVAWAAFVLPTFEIGTLGATVAGVAAMLVLNRLPDTTHPLLAVERFHLASDDTFFLSLPASDPMFQAEDSWRDLTRLNPVALEAVLTEEGA